MWSRLLSALGPRTIHGFEARLLALVLVAVVPLAVLSAYSAYDRRQNDAANVRSQTLVAASLLAGGQRDALVDTQYLLFAVAQYAVSPVLGTPAGAPSEACARYMSELLQQAPRGLYTTIGIATVSGDIICSAVPSTSPVNIADRSYFQNAIQTRAFAIGEFTVGRITGRYTLPVGYPVIDQAGGIRGVAFAGLDSGGFIALIKETGLPEETTATLIDATGVILARYPESPGFVGEASPVFQALAPRLSTDGRVSGEVVGLDGLRRLYTLEHISLGSGVLDVYVAVGVPTAAVFAGANRLLVRNVIALIAVTVGALTVANLGARRWLLHPIERLTETANRFGSGDLAARSGPPYPSSELGVFSRTLDTMADTLGEQAVRLRRMNEDLEQRVAERTAALKQANADLVLMGAHERAAREEADRANQAKSEFLSQMSHELRTPLNAILGFTELLAERAGTRLEPREHQYIGHVREGGQHLLRLINDVLDLARVEAGKTELLVKTITLHRLLEPVIASTQLAATRQGVALQHEFGPGVVLSLDPGRARQILLNLLSNAVKFTPSGGRVTLHAVADGRDLEIRVSDTGIGIPADRQDRVFGPFERLHEDRASIGGTGVGLALTKRLVELQQGQISFESAEGVGTTFRVHLPGVVRGRAEGRRLLVLEDEAASAELMVERAAEAGLESQVIATVDEALEAVRHDPPTAVVVDLRLRGERGEEFLTQLKQDPTTAHVPVLVLSSEDDTGLSRSLGADDHLTKPVDQRRLSRWLQRIADSRRI